jgi:hypothetical protein
MDQYSNWNEVVLKMKELGIIDEIPSGSLSTIDSFHELLVLNQKLNGYDSIDEMFKAISSRLDIIGSSNESKESFLASIKANKKYAESLSNQQRRDLLKDNTMIKEYCPKLMALI